MKARDILAVALRTAAIWVAILALWFNGAAALVVHAARDVAGWSEQAQLHLALLAGIVFTSAGLFASIIRVFRWTRSSASVAETASFRTATSAVAALGPTGPTPARLRNAWRTIRTKYHDANYATWIIARAADESDEQEILHAAEQLHELWLESQSIKRAPGTVAHHEAGHAVVAHTLGCTITKATIIPTLDRKGACEFTLPIPRSPEHEEALDLMAVCLGGRAVDHTRGTHEGGSSNDVEKALRHAAVIVSAGLRPSGYNGPINSEALFTAAEHRARRIVEQHASAVDAIAAELLERKTLGNHDLRPYFGRDEAA